MRASISKHETTFSLSPKIVKLLKGKNYLEIYLAVVTISASLVILFG